MMRQHGDGVTVPFLDDRADAAITADTICFMPDPLRPSPTSPASCDPNITDVPKSLDADGVINLHCLNDNTGWGGGYICYGLAIKLK